MAKAIKRDKPDSVRIPPDIRAPAMKLADKENRTLSNLIVTALRFYIDSKTAVHKNVHNVSKNT